MKLNVEIQIKTLNFERKHYGLYKATTQIGVYEIFFTKDDRSWRWRFTPIYALKNEIISHNCENIAQCNRKANEHFRSKIHSIINEYVV